MLRMFSLMKKNALKILIIVGLLLLQAFCDLSLPEYTSRIVDTGIQQKGIEDGVPESMREKTAQGIMFLSDGTEQAQIRAAYRIRSDGVWKLRKISGKKREELNKTLSEKEMILIYAQQKKTDLSALPEQAGQELLKQADRMLKQYPDSIRTQAAAAFVQQEYKAQGIDVDRRQTRYLLGAGGRMLGMSAISVLCAILVTFFASRVASELGRDLRSKVYSRVLSFSAQEMNRFSTASLITRSTNDIQQVQLVVTVLFRIVLYAPILAAGGVMKVVRTGRYLSWTLIVGVVVILAVMTVLFSLVMPKFRKLQSLIDRVNLISREILTGIPVIRAFSAEEREEERFDGANRELTRTNLFVNRIMSMMMPVLMLLMNGLSVLIIYAGSHGIDGGKIQVGDMMAFLQYAMQILISFLMIGAIAVFMPRANVSAKRIWEVLDTRVTIRTPDAPETPEPENAGTLAFDHVSFRYPDADADVLSDITFRVGKGETLAVIGSTGSGKSTLVNLILRFYDATKGNVKVDGVDVRNMDLHDLRKRLGYVPQKSVLFSGSIASNLRFGSPDASDGELLTAADIAQASDLIAGKPEGINARIAQGGSNVSGGQKQRLSIARAVSAKPEFYLFDDSFSALDFRTDAKLRKRLREDAGDATTILVAQRVSTIMHADQILVLDEGRAAGIGTHAQLLQSCEVYRQIAMSQLSKEELGL